MHDGLYELGVLPLLFIAFHNALWDHLSALYSSILFYPINSDTTEQGHEERNHEGFVVWLCCYLLSSYIRLANHSGQSGNRACLTLFLSTVFGTTSYATDQYSMHSFTVQSFCSRQVRHSLFWKVKVKNGTPICKPWLLCFIPIYSFKVTTWIIIFLSHFLHYITSNLPIFTIAVINFVALKV